MSIEQMRRRLAEHYNHNFAKKLSDSQVVSIFRRLQGKGVIK